MYRGNLTETAILGMCCFLGSFVLYVLNRLDKRQPFSLFQALNVDVSPETGKPLVILADMVVSSALGGGVVLLIASPTTAIQGVVSGLGMTGLLAAHAKGRGDA